MSHYAVIGNPIAHSLSPRIHTLFGAQTGIPLEYGCLSASVETFEGCVRDFFAKGGSGLNVTLPFKLQAYTFAAPQLSPRAQQATAVNTLWLREGVVHGCNTDGVGLIHDLQRLLPTLTGTRILLVGAGGAARGVLPALAQAGCAHIHIVNRTLARAQALVTQWLSSSHHAKLGANVGQRITAGGLADATLEGPWNIVLNATPSSLQSAPLALPPGLYAPNALAYDMMYGPSLTPFMREAYAAGASVVANGLGMLVYQAAESFFIWHGVRPDTQPVLTQLWEAFKPVTLR